MKSHFEKLPYDVFASHVVNKLTLKELNDLCKSSDILKTKCNERNHLIWRQATEDILVESYISYEKIIPYLETTIWDRLAGRLLEYLPGERIDFVTPDIVLRAYYNFLVNSYKGLVNIEEDDVWSFLFEWNHTESLIRYCHNVKIKNDELFIYFNKKNVNTGIKVESEEEENEDGDEIEIPTMIADNIKVLGLLYPYSYAEETERYLINGLILPPNTQDVWIRHLNLKQVLPLEAKIEFGSHEITIDKKTKVKTDIPLKFNFNYDILKTMSLYDIRYKILPEPSVFLLVGNTNLADTSSYFVNIIGKITIDKNIF